MTRWSSCGVGWASLRDIIGYHRLPGDSCRGSKAWAHILLLFSYFSLFWLPPQPQPPPLLLLLLLLLLPPPPPLLLLPLLLLSVSLFEIRGLSNLWNCVDMEGHISDEGNDVCGMAHGALGKRYTTMMVYD